jgi:hypothetical protein
MSQSYAHQATQISYIEGTRNGRAGPCMISARRCAVLGYYNTFHDQAGLSFYMMKSFLPSGISIYGYENSKLWARSGLCQSANKVVLGY